MVLPELRPETFMSRSSYFRDRITDRTLPAVPRLLAISVRAIGARSIFQLVHFLPVAILKILIQIFVEHFMSTVCATSYRGMKLIRLKQKIPHSLVSSAGRNSCVRNDTL